MEAGGEERYRNALCRIAEVIAAAVDVLRIGGVVQLVVESQGPNQRVVGLDNEVVQIRADAISPDDRLRVRIIALEIIAVIPAHHIHVELRLNLVERHNRKLGVKARSV